MLTITNPTTTTQGEARRHQEGSHYQSHYLGAREQESAVAMQAQSSQLNSQLLTSAFTGFNPKDGNIQLKSRVSAADLEK